MVSLRDHALAFFCFSFIFWSAVTLYADDTILAHSAKDSKDITSAMNTELEILKVWLHGTKLSLNVAKTTSMLIGTKQHN